MKLKKLDFGEIVGWYGVAAILLAYGLISFKFIFPESFLFQFLNLTGAVGIVIDAYQDKNYQPVVLNIMWALIAIIALIKLFM